MRRATASRKAILAASVLAVLLAAPLLLCPARAFAGWDGGSDALGCTEPGRAWYFAEGTTRDGFDQWITILNPGAHETSATVTYMLGSGENIERSCTLAPGSRTTVDVDADVPAGSDVSAYVTAPDPIVAERPMYFRYKGVWTGGHTVVGAAGPASKWYFAEGTCRTGFESYICVMNPGDTDTTARVTFMLGDGTTRTGELVVRARSRATVAASDVLGVGDDAAHDFSCIVESAEGAGVVAERPMYFAYKGAWTGGHDVLGATAPASKWYFAEGSCRPGFESYICLMNPGSTRADVRITYMPGEGGTREQVVKVPGHSRRTVAVAELLGVGDDAAHDFSCRVETTNGAGIVAERPMYFAYKGAWTGGHDVVGATAPASKWYFAEGSCRPGFEPYLCVQNPVRGGSADVRVTYMLGDGTAREERIAVAGGTRRTVVVKDVLGQGDDPAHDFACMVEGLGGAPLVVERPTYFSYDSTAKWSLSAVGDVNLGGDMVSLLQSYGFNPWAGVAGLLGGTTLAFANLECAISYRGSPVPGKTFTFRGPPDGLAPMRDAGVDVVSQANNHARDWGAEALVDTIGFLDAAGIGRCGAGADYEGAHTPAYVDANGLRVALLAYNDIGYDGWQGWRAAAGYPGIADAADTGRMRADIEAAKANADLVAVSFHWGTERKYTPDSRQVQLGHYAVDCGADLVLGHHPHVAQGFELYRGRLIAYSLGNFVFNPGSEAGRYTILAQLFMDSRGFLSATVYPVYISNGMPQLMGAGGGSLLGQVADLSRSLGTPMTVYADHATIP